ncbi:response regulator transcription factor [Leucobacter weissii]|uniref:Response regulator transcription factor n=1 Tax=Leucobacter weissii TaxID=1983706 RepID=A0A939SDE6_9MICO|nr:response regulator transcription factor [Leucobacter weissii]MBO1903283.1 response regulator transcription factor [Leucobacter weissii]
MIRVLVADDQALIRGAVTAILADITDIEIVGEAVNGQEAVTLAQTLRPDVILMDIRMPVKDGIEATTEICNDPALSGVHVLIFTTFEEDHYVATALVAGASGFLGKGADPDEIAHAILSRVK